MAKKDGDPTKGDTPLHLVEKGNFAHAACDCGWRGPGRRSRKRAREDAAAHLGEKCSAFKKKK